DYRLGYAYHTYGGVDRETTSLGAGLTHLLYENLTTAVTGKALRSDFTGGREDEFGGELDLDYRRSIPRGVLDINMRHGLKVTRRDLTQQFIQVVDEPHVLTTGDVAVLEGEHVDVGSIVVSDTTGSTVYVENIDYRTTEMGSFVRISRTTFGAITDGQEVLASYRHLSNPSFDDSTFSRSYGIGCHLWRALRVYYRQSHSEQDILSGVRPDRRVDDMIRATEVRLRWKWTTTELSYEDADRSSGISTKKWLAKESVTLRLRNRIFFSVSGHSGRMEFEESGEKEDYSGARTRFDWGLSKRCFLGLEGFWDSISGNTVDTIDAGVSASLNLYYGPWQGSIGYTFLDERDELFDESRTNHSIRVQIKGTM
ncbi:hypothetical protein ACFL01_04195, partial [Planctomycetota bacterium]